MTELARDRASAGARGQINLSLAQLPPAPSCDCAEAAGVFSVLMAQDEGGARLMSCRSDDCRIEKDVFECAHVPPLLRFTYCLQPLRISGRPPCRVMPPRAMPSGPLHHRALTRRASQRAHATAVCPPAGLFLRTARRRHTTCGYLGGPGATGDDDAVPTSIALIVPDETEVVAVQSMNQA